MRWSLQRGTALERATDERSWALATVLESMRSCSGAIIGEHMPEHGLRIAGDSNVAGVAVLVDGMEWRHRDLARLGVHGAPIWDPIDGGVYRPIDPSSTAAESARCKANLTAHHDAVRRAADARVKRAAVDRNGR